MPKQSAGLIGCGVMGENLALNIARNGYPVAIYDSDLEKLGVYLQSKATGTNIVGAESLKDLTGRLEKPRCFILMIPVGKAVDQCLEELVPHLKPEDILIDAGNSHFDDTKRRSGDLKKKGVLFVGAGISGGAEAALEGPSIMVGGPREAWEHVKPLLQAIAARTEDKYICCDWVGEGGAGHFVKMVHNAIEYGEMQLICEAYHLMKEGLSMSPDQIADLFGSWNQERLQSFLLEISHDILRHRDTNGEPVLERILDSVRQKGTGKWAISTALDGGQPFTLVASAVFARFLSALKTERTAAAATLKGPATRYEGEVERLQADLADALYASRVVNHTQGYRFMREAGRGHGWDFDLPRITSLWRGGCIIRSAFLDEVQAAFDRNADHGALLLDPVLAGNIESAQPGWRRVVAAGVNLGIPLPAMSSALTYFDGYRTARLPANLLAAMRDYFGAHGYERVDQPQGRMYHRDWTGDGGESPLE